MPFLHGFCLFFHFSKVRNETFSVKEKKYRNVKRSAQYMNPHVCTWVAIIQIKTEIAIMPEGLPLGSQDAPPPQRSGRS